MVCWRIEEERTDKVGSRLAADPSVSHCYHRPAFDCWPYSVYTMVHGRSETELGAAVDRLAESVAGGEYRVLHTVNEYMKSCVMYFLDDQ